MGRYTAGWVTVPGKGRRWRTEDGQFMMQRPAGGGLQGVMNALGGAWKQADRALGGWLPGGGTPNAASPTIKRAGQGAGNAARAVASTARDRVVVPVIDAAMQAGVVPPKEGMFARYLTGTAVPMTTLPPRLRESLNSLHRNRIFHQEDEYLKRQHEAKTEDMRSDLEAKRSEYQRLRLDRMQRQSQGMGDIPPSDVERMRKLNTELVDWQRGIEFDPQKLSSDERRRRLSGFRPATDGPVGFDETYSQHPLMGESKTGWDGGSSGEAMLTLGRHHVKGSEVIDRYDFNELEKGRTSKGPDGRTMYWSATGGGPLASDLIEAGLKLGILRPTSGYEVRARFR